MPNIIELNLLSNKSIVATMQGYPLANENSYKIVAGDENATQFTIKSKPTDYENATYFVEMVNAKGYKVKTTQNSEEREEIKADSFTLPVGMAVEGYGYISISCECDITSTTIKGAVITTDYTKIAEKGKAYVFTYEKGWQLKVEDTIYKNVSLSTYGIAITNDVEINLKEGDKIIVTKRAKPVFQPLKIKVWNTLPNWKDEISEGGGSGGGGVDQELLDQVNANTDDIHLLKQDQLEHETVIIAHDNYIEFLKQVLPQSGVYGEATVEDTFYTRPTASGVSVVNDYPCKVKKIQGATVIDDIGQLKHANFQKILSTGKNILRPLSQRVYRSMGATANTTPRDWDGKTCSYSMAANGYYKNQLSACSVDKNNETITSDFQSDAYGFVIDFPCQAGLWYTISVKDTENRARVLIGFFDKDGLPIGSVRGVSARWYCVQAPENAVWGAFVITNRAEAIGKTTTYSEFMVEVSTEEKTTPSEYEPYIEAEYGNGNFYELRAYDYIDVKRQVIVRKTGYVSQLEENNVFTEEQLAGYKNYIQALNRMELVYELDEATEEPITIANTYNAYNHGSETVEQGTSDNTTALCTLTIEYTSLGVIE